ncbi:MAG: hypothetical protein A3K19_14920 [Lentisphaerae bacterium RIFOXYB12_FULL_65_16]|nr:MAG: hypothetical protein A3K18_27480 [Lentisphaerae bacterium RIFOXYA12_64_32]OGV85916.1 MAG: hypothetical protein A3K19_14920 [Lentisphaerae bacterium RIFOXYB12_FULL_65_16]
MPKRCAGTGFFDWVHGRWANTSASSTEAQIVIAADWAPIRAFDRIIAETPDAVYGDVLPVLRHGDLRIANLECPLVAQGQPVWKSGSELKGRPEHIKGLTVVPFDVVTLANNHVFDYGTEAFDATQRLLAANAIRTVGAGRSAEDARRPLVLDLRGIRIGIVNFSEGEDLTAAVTGPGVFGWDVDSVVDTVRHIKSTVDVVLVICHCGVEYIPFPPPYVAAAFQRIAAAGADLIVGHHPHVPQGIQVHHGVPICYSLGNFVFYQDTELLYRKLGYLVRVGVTRKAVSCVEIIPYEIQPDRLSLLQGDPRQRFLSDLERVSRPLDGDVQIREAWHGFLRHYGVEGFRQEITMLLEKMAQRPQKGAAMFRNRITTMQHQQHWIDAMTRVIDGTIDTAPQWAYDLTVEWLTRRR